MMNARYKDGRNIDVPVPVGTKGGDPLVLGTGAIKIPAVANIDRLDDGTASVTRVGSFLMQVQAIDGSGNSAVAVLDPIYFNSGATPKLNKNAAGVAWGVALTTLASGTTGEVEVLLLGE